MLLARGKSLRHRPQVRKKRQAASDLKALDGKTCFSLLKKFVPSEFRRETSRGHSGER